jgi:hypothetical protein
MSTTYTAGKYQAEVLDQGFTESASKGTPGFYLQLKILGRYDAAGVVQPCPQYERTYTQYLSSEIGVNILKDDLKALGVQVTELTRLDPEVPGHESLVGRTIDVECKIESYNGKQMERWSIPRRKQAKLSRDAIRDLDAKFSHLLRDGTVPPKPPATKPNSADSPF